MACDIARTAEGTDLTSLLNGAREYLVRFAAQVGMELRQSYARVGKLALTTHRRRSRARSDFRPAAEPLPACAVAASTRTSAERTSARRTSARRTSVRRTSVRRTSLGRTSARHSCWRQTLRTLYGVSAWNLKLEGAKQQNLVITDWEEPAITVDNRDVTETIKTLPLYLSS
jgi:hypothetical protein